MNRAIQKMKGKAPDHGEITHNDNCDEGRRIELFGLISKIKREKKIPKDWLIAIIAPICKKS